MKRRSMPMCASPEAASSNVRRNRSSLSRSAARSSACAPAIGSTGLALAGIGGDSIPCGPLRALYKLPFRSNGLQKNLTQLSLEDFAQRVARQRLDEMHEARLLVSRQQERAVRRDRLGGERGTCAQLDVSRH